MSWRARGMGQRRSGHGDLPKSEKKQNKDGKKYCERRDTRRKIGAARLRKYEEKRQSEKYAFLRALMT